MKDEKSQSREASSITFDLRDKTTYLMHHYICTRSPCFYILYLLLSDPRSIEFYCSLKLQNNIPLEIEGCIL